MSQAENILEDLREGLAMGRKLRLDDKTEKELREMLHQHQNSFYKRFCDFLCIDLSKKYRLKEDVIKNSIQYRGVLKYRDRRAKLREQDFPYVDEVIYYLEHQNLSAELGGSVLKGDKNYRDIDLLAQGSLEAVTNATSGLLGYPTRTEPFPKESADGLVYSIRHIGGPHSYAATTIDERFDIQIGETKIDLSLKVKQ